MTALVGKTLSMTVSHSAQGASGGSYLVRYKADVEILLDTDIDVIIAGVSNDPTPDEVEAAKNAISAGCLEVLHPLNVGARVTVRDLTIHSVDFSPGKFKFWTTHDLRRHLDLLTAEES